MASDLASKSCIPCEGNVPRLEGAALIDLHMRLGNQWRLVDDHHLEKTFECEDFRDGLAFVQRVGELAEREGHHPDIFLTWGRVTLTIFTHKVDGLTESDFILAAKADEVR